MRADDKRHLSNLRVRGSITAALMELLSEKRFSEISITEITTRAGVSRQSYYRNFDSKEDIVESVFGQIHAEATELARTRGVKDFGHDLVLSILEVLFAHRMAIVTLNDSGFAGTNLSIINSYIEQASGSMPSTSIDRYLLSFLAGALYSTCLKWLEDGARESCEEMASFICTRCDSYMLPVELDDT